MASKFKVEMQINKKELKALDKDIDLLFTDIGRQLSSAPKMKPMVDKIQQGMKENSMKFKNHPIWEANKEAAKKAGIINFASPLMVSGQLVDDFIFYAGKPKISQIPQSNEFILGSFTWAAKERKRPTALHINAELAKNYGKDPGFIPSEERFTYIKTNELVKMIMRSPRYPIMDSLLNLYDVDVFRHCERLINEAFKKRK
tara:strand:- start:1361 stop:1963 length:603 start_codon:yes stop_codon:yes gene_type:complete